MSVTMHKWMAKKGDGGGGASLPAGTIPARPGVTGVGTMPALLRGGGGLIQGASADTISAEAGVVEAGPSPALVQNEPLRAFHNGRIRGVVMSTTVPVCQINEGNKEAGTIPGKLLPRSSGDREDEADSPAQGGDSQVEGVDLGDSQVEGVDQAQGLATSPANTVALGVGGGPGQTRYDYSGKQWQDGRWREEHDVEGPGAGTFITVVGLQVDGRWNDGVLTGAYLRQWGTRGG